MEFGAAVAKILGGVVLLGLSTLLLWKGVAMWIGPQSTWGVIGKFVLSILLLLAIPLLFDSGSGLVTKVVDDDSPTMVKLNRQPGAPNHLILLFHGYNGYGSAHANVLQDLSDEATIVAFEPSEHGYDNNAVIAATLDVIDELKPDRISAEGESYGGMTIMDLLRADPDLYLHKVVFNATPSRAGYVEMGGEALQYAKYYPAGVISTGVLRMVQQQELKKPQAAPEPDVNLEAMEVADEASLRISGPTTFDQLAYMGNFTPPVEGEFVGRVGAVDYLHAPADSDGLVRVRESSAELHRAFGDVFTDVPVEAWMDGDKPLHTPTPRRPSPVIHALREAA